MDSELVIRNILSRLAAMTIEKSERQRRFKQLEILAKLRSLQEEIIKHLTKMALTYELETDLRYIQGIKKGRIEGREEGREEGIQKGRIEGREEERIKREQKEEKIVRNILSLKRYSYEEIRELTDVSVERIQEIDEEMKTAKQDGEWFFLFRWFLKSLIECVDGLQGRELLEVGAKRSARAKKGRDLRGRTER